MSGHVIYTDMDGTLLDHHDYSHAPVDALLVELEAQGVPVVPCTSKTRAELIELRSELNNKHPFIVENGAAVFIPVNYFPEQPEETDEMDGYWVKAFVQPCRHWLSVLDDLTGGEAVAYQRFSNLDAGQIAALTGLSTEQAMLAAQREYGEPVMWMGSESAREQFIADLNARGAQVLQGGRFLHVSGHSDKGRALLWLHQQYQIAGNAQLSSIALGDSQNDVAMLEVADHAIVVRSPVHPPPKLQRKNKLYLTQSPGPLGWKEGIQRILK